MVKCNNKKRSQAPINESKQANINLAGLVIGMGVLI